MGIHFGIYPFLHAMRDISMHTLPVHKVHVFMCGVDLRDYIRMCGLAMRAELCVLINVSFAAHSFA